MQLLCKPVKLYLFLLIIGLAATLPGCIFPKKYQQHKPFVYATNINIDGKLSTAEKADLSLKLANQLDDSLKVRLKTVFPGIRFLVKPPVFDTATVIRSVVFMNNLLHAEGYYKSVITWDTSLRVKSEQERVTIRYNIVTGKSYKFDSIAYRLQDSALQQLALSRIGNSLLKKGQPYSVAIVSEEMDRLVEQFRNNGYYKFSRDDLNVERDTVFSALINPSLDPFEQLRLLQQARARQENPVMNVVVQLRNPDALSHFRKYYLRGVSIYPDLDLLDDADSSSLDSVHIKGIQVFNKYNKFKPSFIASQSALQPGAMFRLRNVTRTNTNFSALPIFGQVSVEMQEAKDSTALLDAVVKLYPKKKQDISVTADASYNTGDIITTGNLFGVGLNFGLSNLNVAKQAIQSSTNLRTGVEINVGGRFIQTLQTSLSHSYVFPRLVVPAFLLKNIRTDSLRSQRTVINVAGAYTDRKNFYLLKSFNLSFGYQATRSRRQRKSHTWYFSPFNVEYVLLNPRDSLNKYLSQIPNLKYSFNTGLVVSMIGGYNYIQTGADGNKKNDFRIGVEESGGLVGLIKPLDREANLYRFVKVDADFKHYINYKKSALVFRLYGGIGIAYGKNKDGTREQQLPFFKSFYAGGPYSMRAWQVRQLGVGSSNYFEKIKADSGYSVDRFGDIQLEGNIEYRFNLGTLFGIKVKSALFTDFGNIWYRNKNVDPNITGADFNFNKLYTDLAVGAGTSLRFDFDYFLIRFDWAYKLKNPVYSDVNYGWFHDIELQKGQFQLGINYPF